MDDKSALIATAVQQRGAGLTGLAGLEERAAAQQQQRELRLEQCRRQLEAGRWVHWTDR